MIVTRRFRDNLVVTGEPHIRNFAGSPLVASNGHRLGTLCFLGPKPRRFTAEEMVILVNMAGVSCSAVPDPLFLVPGWIAREFGKWVALSVL